MRRIKIISDGSSWNTHLVDAETGEDIGLAVAIEWKVASESGLVPTMAEAKITFVQVPVELTIDETQVTRLEQA